MAAAPASTVAALLLAAGVAAAPPPVSDAELRAATDELLTKVGAVRRLAPRGAPERRALPLAELRAQQAAALASALGGAELAARARLWEGLGLLPPGTDLAALLAASVGAVPTAYYDPARRRLSVPDGVPLEEQRPVLAHELAHALADQRFGLRQFLRVGVDGRHGLDGDAERARLAVVEGDATLAALEAFDPRGALTGAFALRGLAEGLRAAPGAAVVPLPPWLRAGAAFAHADGLLFVGRVRARSPWSAVDALWAAPPSSSEQVLHPEKYDRREAPLAVAPPRTLGDGWSEVAADVLGELGVRTWLERAAPLEVAARAAAGWGGDRASLFVAKSEGAAGAGGPSDAGVPSDAAVLRDAATPPSSFVAWRTAWDDVAEAEDFARAAAPVLAALSGAARPPPSDDPHLVITRRDGKVYALAWRGAWVGLLLGAPESALTALPDLVAPPAARPASRPEVRGKAPARPRAR